MSYVHNLSWWKLIIGTALIIIGLDIRSLSEIMIYAGNTIFIIGLIFFVQSFTSECEERLDWLESWQNYRNDKKFARLRKGQKPIKRKSSKK